FGQLLVTPLPFDVADAVGALAPWLVLGTDRPRFDDAELAVGAPVQDQAEFPVRPLRKFPDDERIGFRNVAVAFLLRRGCRGAPATPTRRRLAGFRDVWALATLPFRHSGAAAASSRRNPESSGLYVNVLQQKHWIPAFTGMTK